MAVSELENYLTTIASFEDWYKEYNPEGRHGCLEYRDISQYGISLHRRFEEFQNEARTRLADYDSLELLADAQVLTPKPDLPNVSSGETAGLVRRTARALVQNTPNVEVTSKFSDTSKEGIFARHILMSQIIGSDQYSNDMQQNLFASTKSAFTLGFDCVVPTLLQRPGGSWYIKYDTIHYRDVFPDPGVKDVRDSSSVFVRRYLTKEEVVNLIRTEAVGWDIAALKTLLQQAVPPRQRESVAHQDRLHHTMPEGYEIITWYSNTGDPFLTFDAKRKMLLRIEKNKDPEKRHPVFFLVLEKDALQTYGKSQVELVLGRQDFQDLMLNGAMKMWYRNMNPSIIGYGTSNVLPNLTPGKFTNINNPKARIEPFEVNTQTLFQYGTISQQNLGSMLGIVGTPDQQMSSQGVFDTMSATPQGVEQQNEVVDTTTNNYQKAIEGFFSRYCSYALTLYFNELKAVKSVTVSAEARRQLLAANAEEEWFNEDGSMDVDFSEMATTYYVQCVPGTLVELEDQKQMRLLNELFVPLSQAINGLAATEDQELIRNAAIALQYIVNKQIQLSGAAGADSISSLLMTGNAEDVEAQDERAMAVEERMAGMSDAFESELSSNADAIADLREQIRLLIDNQQVISEHLGVSSNQSAQEQ